MFLQVNFVGMYLQGMRDRSMQSETEIGAGNPADLIGQRQETCLTSPMEYKYRVIFVLVLSVIYTLRIAVG